MLARQSNLAGSYHDLCSLPQLVGYIDDPEELRRLNNWRGTAMTQQELNDVLKDAILMRVEAECQQS